MKDRKPTRRAGLRAILVLSIAAGLTIQPQRRSHIFGSFHDAKDASTGWISKRSPCDSIQQPFATCGVSARSTVPLAEWRHLRPVHRLRRRATMGLPPTSGTTPAAPGSSARSAPARVWRRTTIPTDPLEGEPQVRMCRVKGIRRDKPVAWRVFTVQHQGKPFGPALDHGRSRLVLGVLERFLDVLLGSRVSLGTLAAGWPHSHVCES